MRKSNGTGKLVDVDSGKVECQTCRKVWYPPQRPDGWFNEGAFQCPSGCSNSEFAQTERYQNAGG